MSGKSIVSGIPHEKKSDAAELMQDARRALTEQIRGLNDVANRLGEAARDGSSDAEVLLLAQDVLHREAVAKTAALTELLRLQQTTSDVQIARNHTAALHKSNDQKAIVRVRKYTDLDYLAVRGIMDEGSLTDPVSDTRENLKAKIEAQPDSILVGEADGKVIGCIFLIYDGWKALIYRVGVDDGYRKQGIGVVLLEQAERYLSENGAEKVHLYAHYGEDKLHLWYLGLGYYEVGLEVRMMKNLDTTTSQ